jgi:hypothetical protein
MSLLWLTEYSFNWKEWIRTTKPYPISLNLRKLKGILDVNKPMDTDCFNMVVRMLACNEGLLVLEEKYGNGLHV